MLFFHSPEDATMKHFYERESKRFKGGHGNLVPMSELATSETPFQVVLEGRPLPPRANIGPHDVLVSKFMRHMNIQESKNHKSSFSFAADAQILLLTNSSSEGRME